MAAIMLVLWVATAPTVAPRIQSNNGAWLLPVAGNVLCSDEHKHIGRGSVRAWDLCVPYGSATYPIADGIVEYAGCSNAGGYGCWLYINHGDGYKAIYAHQIEGSITVHTGDSVRQNQQIGRVGWTGMTSFGPHVHLEIHHPSAANNRVMIDQYFNRALLRDCPLCNTPGTPTAAGGTTYAANSLLTPQAGLLWVGVFCLYLAFWFLHEHKWVWVATVHNAFVLVLVGHWPIVLVILMSLSPVGTVGPTLRNDEQWRYVYAFMRRWEGNSCTVDPILTYRGVTQGTYNRYRMELGMGPGNVCRDMTDRQMQDIYYRYYYQASGADRLPTAIALHHFDFAVNAGVGAARRAHATCGNDFGCYTRYRVQFYRDATLCQLYCAGWLNRVNDLQQYVMGES